MIGNEKSFSRYLPVSRDAEEWGLCVTDCGFTRVAPQERYPPLSHRPESYALSWEHGRSLLGYQIIYITQGCGHFEAGGIGQRTISAGTALLLFPSVWHRYRPDPGVGWHEFWIGFRGDHADRVMKRFYQDSGAVLEIGLDDPLLARFISVAEMVRDEPFGYRNIAASQTLEVLARVHALSQGRAVRSKFNEELVRKSCCHFLEYAGSAVDLERLSADLGVSYSYFRKIFKQHTGLPPAQYHLQLRLLKAEELLRATAMSIGQVAEHSGFESLYYFSRLFKRKNGVSPREFRNRSMAQHRV